MPSSRRSQKLPLEDSLILSSISMTSGKESSTYRTSFGLNRIEIYVTRFQFPFQRFNIRLKYIIIDAMLEMLP